MNRTIIFIFPLLAFLASCGGQKVVATKYYVVEIPMDSVLAENKDLKPITDKNCEISDVDINPAYATMQIANRSSSRALTYYSHHHWAIRPSVSFSRIILDYFIHLPVFNNVSDRFWRIQPEYILETTIYHLEVIQDKNTFSAHLNLEFRLKDTNNDNYVIQHRADRHMALENNDLNLFATSIGEIFFQELQELSGKVRSTIK